MDFVFDAVNTILAAGNDAKRFRLNEAAAKESHIKTCGEYVCLFPNAASYFRSRFQGFLAQWTNYRMLSIV